MTNTSHQRAIPYLPAIDGLRAIAVLGVVAFHLSPRRFPSGFVGVDIFFVISGFLITAVLLRSGTTTGDLLRFYQRRVARLLPALTAMLAVTTAACVILYQDVDLSTAGKHLVYTSLYAANIGAIRELNGYFQLSSDSFPYLHCWSIAVEEQFYLLYPMLLILLRRFLPRTLRITLAALFACSLTLCLLTPFQFRSVAFYLLPLRAWQLLAGCLLAACLRGGIDGPHVPPRYAAALMPAGLLLVSVSFFAVRASGYPNALALLPVLGATLTLAGIAFHARGSAPATALLQSAPLVFIGKLSYSLYLWHWPVFSLVDYRLYAASGSARAAVKLILTIATTLLSYFCIERPARRFFNSQWRAWPAFAFGAAAIAVLIPVGLYLRMHFLYDNNPRTILRGGMVFERQNAGNGTLLLMGDSEASMYARMLRGVAEQQHLQFVVASISNNRDLPVAGQTDALWSTLVGIARKEHPRVLIYVCDWAIKLRDNPEQLARALADLRPYAQTIIVVQQYPILPGKPRELIRSGIRPPLFESPMMTKLRRSANTVVAMSAEQAGAQTIAVEPLFLQEDGSVRFVDEQGSELYEDSRHLSSAGARRVEPLLLAAVRAAQRGPLPPSRLE